MKLIPNARQQFSFPNGTPLANGSVGMYIPSTMTPSTTWQDQAGLIPNTNPVTLDANGQCSIFGTGSYRQILKDSNGNTIWDAVTSANEPNEVNWITGGP